MPRTRQAEKHEKLLLEKLKMKKQTKQKRRQTCKSSFHFDEPPHIHRHHVYQEIAVIVVAHRFDFHFFSFFFRIH